MIKIKTIHLKKHLQTLSGFCRTSHLEECGSQTQNTGEDKSLPYLSLINFGFLANSSWSQL